MTGPAQPKAMLAVAVLFAGAGLVLAQQAWVASPRVHVPPGVAYVVTALLFVAALMITFQVFGFTLERPTGGCAAGRDHGGDAVVRFGVRSAALLGRIVAPAGGCVQGCVGPVRADLRRDDGVGHCTPPGTAAGGLM